MAIARSTRMRTVGGWSASVLLIVSLGLATAGYALAQELDPDPSQVESLVHQLGDTAYERRESAERELEALGVLAIPVLKSVVDSRDLELRYRARRLVEVIELAELHTRLSAFEESPEPALAFGLPGWERFSGLIGDDVAACRLFAEMLRADSEVMQLVDRRGVELSQMVDERCLELGRGSDRSSRTQLQATAGICVLLLALLDPQCQISPTAASSLYGALYQSQFQLVVRSSSHEPAHRLLGLWVANASQVTAFNRVQLAVRLGLREGADAAVEAIRTGMHDSQLPTAILAIAGLGGPQHLDALQPLLENDTVVSERQDHQKGETFTCQVRDVALLATLHLMGQNPADFGFDDLQRHSQTVYSPASAGFKSDKERERAFHQWRLWRAMHLDRSRHLPGSAVEGVGV